MFDETNNGGPAFPIPQSSRSTGMSLRDYFAAQAIIGLLSSPDYRDADGGHYAGRAYAIADAMLAERAK